MKITLDIDDKIAELLNKYFKSLDDKNGLIIYLNNEIDALVERVLGNCIIPEKTEDNIQKAIDKL